MGPGRDRARCRLNQHEALTLAAPNAPQVHSETQLPHIQFKALHIRSKGQLCG